MPSKYTVVRNFRDDEFAGPYGDDAWVDQGSAHVGSTSSRGGRGRGRGRVRGGKSQRVVGSRGESSIRSLASYERPGQVLGGWKNQSVRGKGGRKKGRRSARSRQRPIKKTPAVADVSSLQRPIPFDISPPGFSQRHEWNAQETRDIQIEEADANDDSMSERSEYNDDNGQASGEEYDDMAVDTYTSVYNGSRSHLMDGNNYNVEEDEEDDHDEVGDDDVNDDVEGGNYEQGGMDASGFLNHGFNDEGNGDGDGEQDGVQGGTSDFASTDYSSGE